MGILHRICRLVDTIWLALFLWQPINCFLAQRHPELTFRKPEVVSWRTAWNVSKTVFKD